MNKTNTLVGSGIALIVGSLLAVAPAAASAAEVHPTRICVDNGSSSQCESVVLDQEGSGAGGQEVAVRPVDPGRLDAKDHPNYGPVDPGRLDAKDHPNYGPVNPGRLDAKDHPNYGPVDPNLRLTSTPDDGGRVIERYHPSNPPL